MAATPTAFRSKERQVVDQFVDMTMSVAEASALLTLVGLAGGTGYLATLLGQLEAGLEKQEEHLLDISYAVVAGSSADGQPQLIFSDPPVEPEPVAEAPVAQGGGQV